MSEKEIEKELNRNQAIIVPLKDPIKEIISNDSII